MEKTAKPPFECHVYVCTNQKPDGRECCAQKGAEELRKQLKEWAKSKYGNRVRINAAGCLDHCTQGIAMAIYPKSQWYLKINSSDLESLKNEISRAVDGSN